MDENIKNEELLYDPVFAHKPPEGWEDSEKGGFFGKSSRLMEAQDIKNSIPGNSREMLETLESSKKDSEETVQEQTS